jgi:hypothetical protein
MLCYKVETLFGGGTIVPIIATKFDQIIFVLSIPINDFIHICNCDLKDEAIM